MAAPRTTLKNIKRGVEEYRKAAILLLQGGCPGQAAARAYYQVHCVAQHIALLLGPPFESQRDGRPLGRLLHTDLTDVVARVWDRQGKRGAVVVPHLNLDAAHEYADALTKARMDADYRPYQAFSGEHARKLLLYADTLKIMLIAEAELIEADRALQAKSEQKGEAS